MQPIGGRIKIADFGLSFLSPTTHAQQITIARQGQEVRVSVYAALLYLHRPFHIILLASLPFLQQQSRNLGRLLYQLLVGTSGGPFAAAAVISEHYDDLPKRIAHPNAGDLIVQLLRQEIAL